MSAPRFDNFDFPSTGTAEGDAIERARIRKQLAREAEGMCPNGCAALTWPDREDVAVCPSCGFCGVGYDRDRHDPLRAARREKGENDG